MSRLKSGASPAAPWIVHGRSKRQGMITLTRMIRFYHKTIRWTNEKFSQGLPLTFSINLVVFRSKPIPPLPSPPTSTIPVGFLTFQPG